MESENVWEDGSGGGMVGIKSLYFCWQAWVAKVEFCHMRLSLKIYTSQSVLLKGRMNGFVFHVMQKL